MTTKHTLSGTDFEVPNRYTPLRVLGKGAYGVVCLAKDNTNHEKVAIKKVSGCMDSVIEAKHVIREIRLMRCLGLHPNIIGLRDAYRSASRKDIYFVLDFMDSDLHRLLHAVKFMHENDVLHRDLKPGNLLVKRNCDLCVTDFGLARVAAWKNDQPDINNPEAMTQHVVTRWYRPPEIMLNGDGVYTESIDIWSVGCILAELLGRTPLFPGENFIHQLTLIFNVIGTPPQHKIRKLVHSSEALRFMETLGKLPKISFSSIFPSANPLALDLLKHLLVFDPSERYSASQALEHPYFQDVAVPGMDHENIPECPSIDIDFEDPHITLRALREMIQQEVGLIRQRAKIAETINISSTPSLVSSAETETKETRSFNASTNTSRARSNQRPSSAMRSRKQTQDKLQEKSTNAREIPGRSRSTGRFSHRSNQSSQRAQPENRTLSKTGRASSTQRTNSARQIGEKKDAASKNTMLTSRSDGELATHQSKSDSANHDSNPGNTPLNPKHSPNLKHSSNSKHLRVPSRVWESEDTQNDLSNVANISEMPHKSPQNHDSTQVKNQIQDKPKEYHPVKPPLHPDRITSSIDMRGMENKPAQIEGEIRAYSTNHSDSEKTIESNWTNGPSSSNVSNVSSHLNGSSHKDSDLCDDRADHSWRESNSQPNTVNTSYASSHSKQEVVENDKNKQDYPTEPEQDYKPKIQKDGHTTAQPFQFATDERLQRRSLLAARGNTAVSSRIQQTNQNENRKAEQKVDQKVDQNDPANENKIRRRLSGVNIKDPSRQTKKKTTIPKSPNFSVMSWQRRK